MTLYETIFARRSVRSYDMTTLSDGVLAEIQLFINNVKQLDGQHARLEIVAADRVNNNIAPHYVLAYCKADDIAYINVGYVLQNVDLYLQSSGYGSLWLGMAKPNAADKDNFCIMLAFGKTNLPLRRGVHEFKRLPIGEISDTDSNPAQAVRLSPSAMNSQPWKLDFAENSATIRYFGRGVSGIMLKKKLSKIDLGIATRHIEIALQNEGKTIKTIIPVVGRKDFSVKISY